MLSWDLKVDSFWRSSYSNPKIRKVEQIHLLQRSREFSISDNLLHEKELIFSTIVSQKQNNSSWSQVRSEWAEWQGQTDDCLLILFFVILLNFEWVDFNDKGNCNYNCNMLIFVLATLPFFPNGDLQLFYLLLFHCLFFIIWNFHAENAFL